jgi:hypothetical protein|tara:strand:- start:269 stop:532 length:264 start_codon:yes stop_codon:yes gene_type:complete
MELRRENKTWTYHGPDYIFVMADEKHHEYTSLVVKPSHIKVLKNFSDMSTKDLKARIIEDWFVEQNVLVKDNNNEKARERRATLKGV